MTEPGERLRDRFREELRAYAIAVIYLYVCLGSLLLLESGVRREAGAAALPHGLALGKALVLGKFLLIGEAARLGARAKSQTLLHLIARRALVFFALLVGLSLVEELVVGWIHGSSAAETWRELVARSPLELIGTCLVLGLVLVPYVAARELDRRLGPGGLRRLLRQPPAIALVTEGEREPK